MSVRWRFLHNSVPLLVDYFVIYNVVRAVMVHYYLKSCFSIIAQDFIDFDHKFMRTLEHRS